MSLFHAFSFFCFFRHFLRWTHAAHCRTEKLKNSIPTRVRDKPCIYIPGMCDRRHFFNFYFPSPSPFVILALLFLSPSYGLIVVTQIRGHIAGSFSPSPLRTVRALHFYREKISALSSLVDSRRIVLTRARRSQQLILFFSFLQINSRSHHGGIRTHGPTLLIVVLVVAFEGYH